MIAGFTAGERVSYFAANWTSSFRHCQALPGVSPQDLRRGGADAGRADAWPNTRLDGSRAESRWTASPPLPATLGLLTGFARAPRGRPPPVLLPDLLRLWRHLSAVDPPDKKRCSASPGLNSIGTMPLRHLGTNQTDVRCQAEVWCRTRTGTPCKAPAIPAGWCRMHGGRFSDPRTAEGLERLQAAGTTHGRRTAEMERMRAMVRVLMPMMAWTQHSCHQAQSSAIRPARSASSQDRWRWRRRARPLARRERMTGRRHAREVWPVCGTV